MPIHPLTNVRVIEVGHYGAAPYCGMQLGDLGAEVIKIENPDGGDLVRGMGPFINGEGSLFQHINRNKRSLALDLKSPDGKDIFKRLISGADIVIENLRPGNMRKLGLDYETVLRVLNTQLIYVAISGWGQDGPLSQFAGLDIMAQARSGLMSITGEPGGNPVKVGVPICDLLTGIYGALAAVAALSARSETGRGQFIDVCLLEAAVSVSVWEAAKYFVTGEIPQPMGSANQAMAPYQAFRSSDGWLTIGAPSPPTWSALCKVLDLEQIEHDERYTNSDARYLNRGSLIPTIEDVTKTQGTDYWLELLQVAGVPCAPIQDYGQVYSDPHLLARSYFWNVLSPKLGPIRQLGSPMRFSETKVRTNKAAPLLGEDSADVLHELGYSETVISSLNERSVIRLDAGS